MLEDLHKSNELKNARVDFAGPDLSDFAYIARLF